MRSSPVWVAPLLVLLAVVLASCSPHRPSERRERAASDSASALAAPINPADVPHPCPPQPAGPQVGRSDPALNAAAPRLAEWSALWAHALPGFATDSLWGVGRERWKPDRVIAYERSTPGVDSDREEQDDLAADLLDVRSPDRRLTLCVDSYQVVIPAGDSIEVGGDPDARCSLIDQRHSTETVLMQTGSMAGYHWGAWLSPASFVLGGWTEADDYGQWMQGQLWIYSLSDSTVSSYVTRIVPAGDYEKYRAAWHGLLLRRYREWKRTHPPA